MRINEILIEGPLSNLVKKGAAAIKRDFTQGYHPGDDPNAHLSTDQQSDNRPSTTNFKRSQVQSAVTAALSGKRQFTSADKQVLQSFAASDDANLAAVANMALKGNMLGSQDKRVLQDQIKKYV